MKKTIVILSLLMLSACSTMQPPRYAISVDNIQAMKAYAGARAEVVSLYQTATFNSGCRLMGPIEPADGLTVPQFIAKAFNDEFKMAGIHSNQGVQISGDVTKIEFSSITGLTNGYWDIGLQLKASNGQTLTVNNKYTFRSGFDAITACNATADALTPAVQDLIKATIAHPGFKELLTASNEGGKKALSTSARTGAQRVAKNANSYPRKLTADEISVLFQNNRSLYFDRVPKSKFTLIIHSLSDVERECTMCNTQTGYGVMNIKASQDQVCFDWDNMSYPSSACFDVIQLEDKRYKLIDHLNGEIYGYKVPS